MTYLSPEQVGQLLKPINPKRVSKDRDGMSHLQAYDVRAHLNRVLGFGRWSSDVIDVTQLYEAATTTKSYENKPGKPAFAVAYRCTVRLTVCAPDGTVLATYTESATGGNVMPDFKRADSHDFAIKTAASQALKRCATNLGDQFGLSLYANGSQDAVVKGTLVGTETAEAPEPEVTPEADGGLYPVAGVNPRTGEIVAEQVATSSQPGQSVDVTDPANQWATEHLGEVGGKAERSKGRQDNDPWQTPVESKADKAEKWMSWYCLELDKAVTAAATAVLLAKASAKKADGSLDDSQFETLERLTQARQDDLEVGASV